MIAYEGVSPRVGDRWLHCRYLRRHHEMSVEHSRLRAILDFRQQLARLEGRAIRSQDAICRRMFLQIRKGGLLEWEDLRNSLKY